MIRHLPLHLAGRLRLAAGLLVAFLPLVAGAAKPSNPVLTPWGEWVEKDFPFFSSVLDARRAGPCEKNLTPRGIVLPLGMDCWVCFDTDLLRVASVWSGRGVTDKALAPGSYHDAGRKTLGGQFPAPQPDGKVWFGNGIYPGWQGSESPSFADPREPAPTPSEVGRGPLPESYGRMEAVRLLGDSAVLEYSAFGAKVSEWFAASGSPHEPVIERHVSVGPSAKPLLLIVGAKSNGPSQEIPAGVTLSLPSGSTDAAMVANDDYWVVRVLPRSTALDFCLSFSDEREAPAVKVASGPASTARARWPQELRTSVQPSPSREAYVVDKIVLPEDNPWKRAVRMSDIQFLSDGTGVGVTLDGDVWTVRGLHEAGGAVRWRRFASGLHEPMSVAVRNDEVFVFDRNGIWRLRDTNGDGEADVHELFSNAFAQTADMREFPSTLRLAPGGDFVIAKGGQEATTLGKHNGHILKISADGKTSTVLGYGFRQPNLAVNPRTGLVTASDQQGQYVPSTPLHIVRDRQFYGFLGDKRPREQYPAPIADPLTWIPHSVNASGLSQVWLFDAKMGPLNDSLVHIGFNKPELFRVMFNTRSPKPQASVASITSAFDFPPLNGSVNPLDGQLYIAGFQVLGWGCTLNTVAGFGRVRYTGAASMLVREVAAMEQGVLLRFDSPLDRKRASDPANYSAGTWAYKRAYTYGSAQYKADGKVGVDWLTPSSAYVSKDGRSVFVGIPGMTAAMQLRIGWSLAADSGKAVEGNAYTTPYVLEGFQPEKEGFERLNVDLTPRSEAKQAAGPVTVDEGRRLSQVFGCVACHSTGDQDLFHIGPKWKGLFGSQRNYTAADKTKGTAVADEAYLRESILDPHAKTVAGFEKGEYAMPSYAGVLTESQVEALVQYIKSLK
jgi:mono/diheme cytochrome c family protein